MEFKKINFGILLLTAVISCFPAEITAQIINKIYPTSHDKTARDIMKTADGGYLIVGMTNNASPTDCDLYVLKTNNIGEPLFDTVYGGARPDYAYSMIDTHDGNFIIVGYTQSFGSGDYDMYFLKVNQHGKFIAQTDLGSTGNEEARQIIRTDDNKYVVVGTKNMNSANSQIWLVVMDDNFGSRAEYEFGGSGHDYGLCLQKRPGGYMIGGQTWSKGGGGGDAYVIALKQDFTVEWDSAYGGALNEEVVGLAVNDDGSAVLAIRDSLPNEPVEGNIDVLITKIAADGKTLYKRRIGGAEKDTPKCIAAMGNGAYMVGAISRSFNWMEPQMWLMKFQDDPANNKIDTVWTRNYGTKFDHDHCHMIKKSEDGGMLVVGHHRTSAMQIWFMKLNGEGTVGLKDNETVPPSIVVFPNPSNDGIFKMTGAAGNVKVTDIMGSVIFSTDNVKSSEIELDLRGSAPGVYFVNIRSGDIVHTRKILID